MSQPLMEESEQMRENAEFVKIFEENFYRCFGGGSSRSDSNEEMHCGHDRPPDEDDLSMSEQKATYTVVLPEAGFCVKTFRVNGTEGKYFVNVCHTEAIPAPVDIDIEQLAEVLRSHHPGHYRVPMSITETRMTKDRANRNAEVCDIAINSDFYRKCAAPCLFRDFLIALIIEALYEKHKVIVSVERTIVLVNRKFIGTLVSHRIHDVDIKQVLNAIRQYHAVSTTLQSADQSTNSSIKTVTNAGILIDKGLAELAQSSDADTSAPNTKTNVRKLKREQRRQQKLAKQQHKIKQAQVAAAAVAAEAGLLHTTRRKTLPEFKLRAKLRRDRVEEVLAEFFLPKCESSQDFHLDVGEDCIILSAKCGYYFEKNLKFRLHKEAAKGIFDQASKMLQVRIPVLHTPQNDNDNDDNDEDGYDADNFHETEDGE